MAERDDQADAGAAGRWHVEAEAGLTRRIAAAAVEEVREEVEPEAGTDDDDMERLIVSLPLFTTASPLAALQKNFSDCAVCLSPFDDDGTKLRLLPACRHAFHAACIDTWLRANLVCPICRTAVSSPLPPLPVVAAGDDDQEPEAAAVAKSASSLSGWWSQGYRRDMPRQWDMEAAHHAGRENEEEPWALMMLARWIFGLHDC